MQDNMKLSVRQFSVLVLFFNIGTTILIIPSGLAADAKQDAWIASLVGLGFGLLLTLLYNNVAKLFPDMSLVQFNERLFGRWLGICISLLVVFYSFIGGTTLLYYVGNFISTQVMSETPIQFINILFVSIVVMGLRLGLETLARAAEILFPWFILLFVVIVMFVAPQIEIRNLEPVLEVGAKPILKAALSLVCTATLPLIVLFMIYPVQINNPKEARKDFLFSVLIGGIIITLTTFLTISVLGVDTTARNLYPSYALAKKISVGNFVERIESIIAGMWFMSIYFKMTLYCYACIVGLSQILRLKDYRPLCLPFGMILVVYSLVVYPNTNYMMKWDTTIYIPYALTFGLLLPLILWGTAAVKRKFGL